MKKSRFSESQIIAILKEFDSGISAADVCRKHGMSQGTLYNWKSKYGGMETSELKRLKELEDENRRLKKMFAELSMDNEVLKEIIEKKL